MKDWRVLTGEAAKSAAEGARAENECEVWRERLTKKADDAQGGVPTRQHIASSLTLMIINQKSLSGNEATFRQQIVDIISTAQQ